MYLQLIIQSFFEAYGINFNKIFCLSVRKKLLEIFFIIIYFSGFIIEQIDII